jgi:hypothetical protein
MFIACACWRREYTPVNRIGLACRDWTGLDRIADQRSSFGEETKVYSKQTTVEGARHVIFHMSVRYRWRGIEDLRRKETSRVFVSSPHPLDERWRTCTANPTNVPHPARWPGHYAAASRLLPGGTEGRLSARPSHIRDHPPL